MGRMLGIDYGKKRIGLALTDPSKILASPLKVVSPKELLNEIKAHDIEAIVMGLPLLLSGKESETSLLVRELKTDLEKELDIPITLWDERLTSKQVEKVMIAGGVKRKKRTQHVDCLCAVLILQSYLDSKINFP